MNIVTYNTFEEARTQIMTAAMRSEAHRAAEEYFYNALDGEDRGACGFAWVEIVPKHKGNTRDGKAERKIFAAMGFEKSWDGKNYYLWNPASFPVQNVDVLYAGARAAAKFLQDQGFSAHACSRLD